MKTPIHGLSVGDEMRRTRCAAQTRSGRRCLNSVYDGGDFCSAHQDNISSGAATATVAGAIIGNMVVPGLGGALIGGIAGHVARLTARRYERRKTKVFVSFDFDNDRALKDFIIGQSKHSEAGFEVVDHSLKEAAPERDWKRKACAAIGRSDLVLVMVGRNTYKAKGVIAEISMAREAGIPIAQMIGYREGTYTPVIGAGRLYSWSRENLHKLLG